MVTRGHWKWHDTIDHIRVFHCNLYHLVPFSKYSAISVEKVILISAMLRIAWTMLSKDVRLSGSSHNNISAPRLDCHDSL